MRAFVLLLLLSGCGEEACRLERLAVLPVRVAGNVPVVEVEINGKPASLSLDMASYSTVRRARRVG